MVQLPAGRAHDPAPPPAGRRDSSRLLIQLAISLDRARPNVIGGFGENAVDHLGDELVGLFGEQLGECELGAAGVESGAGRIGRVRPSHQAGAPWRAGLQVRVGAALRPRVGEETPVVLNGDEACDVWHRSLQVFERY
jgi:hypothetical protein